MTSLYPGSQEGVPFFEFLDSPVRALWLLPSAYELHNLMPARLSLWSLRHLLFRILKVSQSYGSTYLAETMPNRRATVELPRLSSLCLPCNYGRFYVVLSVSNYTWWGTLTVACPAVWMFKLSLLNHILFFQAHLGLTRDEFCAAPRWKQLEIRKEKGLFWNLWTRNNFFEQRKTTERKFLTVFLNCDLFECVRCLFSLLYFSLLRSFFFCYDVCYKSRINIFFQVIPDAVINLKWIFTATRKSLNFFDTHLDCWPINFWMTFLIFFGFSVILVGYGFWKEIKIIWAETERIHPWVKWFGGIVHES